MTASIPQILRGLTQRPDWFKMGSVRLVSCSWVFILLSLLSSAAPARASIEIDRVDGSTVYFKSTAPTETTPRPLQTHLHEIQVLGLLKRESLVPHLLLLAKPCDGCGVEKAVYLVPGAGGRPQRFDQPGKILDPRKGMLAHESRAFFGRCLSDTEEVYVAFQKDRADRRRGLQASVLVAKPGAGFVEENLYERRLPRIESTLRRVKQKKCTEIPARNRSVVVKPLYNAEYIARAGALKPLDAGDDEDEDEKANEAEKLGVEKHGADSPAVLIAPETGSETGHPAKTYEKEITSAPSPSPSAAPTGHAPDPSGAPREIPQPDPSPSISR